ncbi:MAG: hypothetical protein ACD_75C01214G0002 [uncultured bacterium]|nr:MAG: hypothetical protein ACD_75C01214G0002 [uncultured bacterium]
MNRTLKVQQSMAPSLTSEQNRLGKVFIMLRETETGDENA